MVDFCTREMKLLARSWEAAFSLSESSREGALRSSRLRHRHSMVMNRPRIPISDINTSTPDCKSTNLLTSYDEKATEVMYDDKYVVAEPISQTKKPKKTRRLRKPATLTMKFTDCDPIAMLPTSTCELSEESHESNPQSTDSCSESVHNVEVDAVLTRSTMQTSVPSSACTSRKRTKVQMETIDLMFDYDNLPIHLDADYFKCDALELAPKLLGKFLRRDDVVVQITEVEAYRPNDSACHGRFGVTPRTAAMFGPGGHAYVYLCYGLHVMLNIVADIKGVGAAVLIRSCAPIAGLQTIQSRRGILSSKPILLTGPGKVGQALGLTTDWSSHPLYTAGGLELLDGPTPVNILVGPRVGINYAKPEDATALWRFAIADTQWISAPRNNLKPRESF